MLLLLLCGMGTNLNVYQRSPASRTYIPVLTDRIYVVPLDERIYLVPE